MQRLYPYSLNVLLKRAALARSLNKKDEAIAFIKSALRIRPDSTRLHTLLGEYYHAYDMKDAANAEWDLAGKIRKSFPKLTEYHNVISPPKDGELFEQMYASMP